MSTTITRRLRPKYNDQTLMDALALAAGMLLGSCVAALLAGCVV